MYVCKSSDLCVVLKALCVCVCMYVCMYVLFAFITIVRSNLKSYLRVMTSSDEIALRSYIQAVVLNKVRMAHLATYTIDKI